MLYRIEQSDRGSSARCGALATPHGEVLTPAFMPVGTRATVRAMDRRDLEDMGYRLVLANAYHLYLRPGLEVLREAGGLHEFMGWPGAILTDSGGFQVFSLSGGVRVTDEGVQFASVYDGSRHLFTPERVVEMQEVIGSDIAVALDQCVGYPCDKETARDALRRTLEWARRSLDARRRQAQALFGVVQGSTYAELRLESARALSDMPFDGFCVGGLSVGEPRKVMLDMAAVAAAELPVEVPRHLLGVGDPGALVAAVGLGYDLFDCVMPTRAARNALAFTSTGRVNLRNAKHRGDRLPLDSDCGCPACREHTRAYLHHLVQNSEILGIRLLTRHNLTYLAEIMSRCRDALRADRFAEFSRAFLDSPAVCWGNEV